jgi:hypothetical protein
MSGFMQQPQPQQPQPNDQLMQLLQGLFGPQQMQSAVPGMSQRFVGYNRPDNMNGVSEYVDDNGQVGFMQWMTPEQNIQYDQNNLFNWWAENYKGGNLNSTAGGPPRSGPDMPNPLPETPFKQPQQMFKPNLSQPMKTFQGMPNPTTRVLGGENGMMNPWKPQKNIFGMYGK